MRILLITEKKNIIKEIPFALQSVGCYCFPVKNPLTALKKYKKHAFDVVLYDLDLKKKIKFNFFKLLYKIDYRARVIIFTQEASLANAARAGNAGTRLDCYVLPPCPHRAAFSSLVTPCRGLPASWRWPSRHRIC